MQGGLKPPRRPYALMASDGRVGGEQEASQALRGMGNDPLSLDPMRWGEIAHAADADKRQEPEPTERQLESERSRRTPRRTQHGG